MAIIGKIRERSMSTMVGLGLDYLFLHPFRWNNPWFQTKMQILDCLITMKLILKHGVIMK